MNNSTEAQRKQTPSYEGCSQEKILSAPNLNKAHKRVVTLGSSVVANDYNADNEFRDAYDSGGSGTYNGSQTEDPQDWIKE